MREIWAFCLHASQSEDYSTVLRDVFTPPAFGKFINLWFWEFPCAKHVGSLLFQFTWVCNQKSCDLLGIHLGLWRQLRRSRAKIKFLQQKPEETPSDPGLLLKIQDAFHPCSPWHPAWDRHSINVLEQVRQHLIPIFSCTTSTPPALSVPTLCQQ